VVVEPQRRNNIPQRRSNPPQRRNSQPEQIIKQPQKTSPKAAFGSDTKGGLFISK